MGFSSEAVASWTSVQWALPLIVAAERSPYHVPICCEGCAGHFSNLIRRRHLPAALQPIKVSQLRARSRVCFPPGHLYFCAFYHNWHKCFFFILLWIFYISEVAKPRCLRREHVGKAVIIILHVRMLIAKADVAAVLTGPEIWDTESKNHISNSHESDSSLPVSSPSFHRAEKHLVTCSRMDHNQSLSQQHPVNVTISGASPCFSIRYWQMACFYMLRRQAVDENVHCVMLLLSGFTDGVWYLHAERQAGILEDTITWWSRGTIFEAQWCLRHQKWVITQLSEKCQLSSVSPPSATFNKSSHVSLKSIISDL